MVTIRLAAFFERPASTRFCHFASHIASSVPMDPWIRRASVMERPARANIRRVYLRDWLSAPPVGGMHIGVHIGVILPMVSRLRSTIVSDSWGDRRRGVLKVTASGELSLLTEVPDLIYHLGMLYCYSLLWKTVKAFTNLPIQTDRLIRVIVLIIY